MSGPRIGCVVLAAGQSLRFGANKLLQPLLGRPVLLHTLDCLPLERLDRAAVVVSCPETAALCRAAGLPCLLYEGGPQSQSIRIGIGAMEGLDGCLFVMGDQPLCARRSVEKILDAFAAGPERIVRLSFQGRACSPVLFPKTCFSALAALTGERGGMAAVRGLEPEPEILLVEAGDEAELWDADTPEELAQIQRRLAALG